jgi:large conductance mechanosensitive channel
VCKGTVAYGAFITTVVNFLIVALAVFIFIKTFEKLQHLRAEEVPEPEPLTRSEELLTEIRNALVQERP